MDTLPENTLSNFDLDLLLCPATTSIFENINHGYQHHNMGNSGTSDQQYQIHSMGNTSADDNYQVKNMENELYLPVHVDHNAVKKSDYESLQKDYEAKSSDYDEVKKQYAKLASDYAKLHDENKKHALEALNVSTMNVNLEKQAATYQTEITALREQMDRLQTNNFAQSSSLAQYQNYVLELQTQNTNLKNDVKTEKNNGKDGRKMISTLNNTNKNLKEYLCLFACIIEGRKQLDKETHRILTKYCSKSTLSKKSVDVDSFENHSVDTGRGSSLAFSDGERSFYSPAYSINFSPQNSTNVTRNEPTKMRDASSSPLPMIKTFDISTSPIIFEEAVSLPLVITTDASTNTITNYEARTPEVKTKTLDIATSPVKFADIRSPGTKSNTLDIATSPIQYTDTRIPVAKIKTLDIATSPVYFADKGTAVNTKTMGIAKTPDAKTKVVDIATSPIKFADTSTPVAKTKTVDIASSPVKFADAVTSIANTKMKDVATSPVKFANTGNLVVKTKTFDISTNPLKFAQTKTLKFVSSPVESSDTNTPLVNTNKVDIVTSPIEISQVRTPENKTPMLDMTRPFASDDASIPVSNITENLLSFSHYNTVQDRVNGQLMSVNTGLYKTSSQVSHHFNMNEVTIQLKEIDSQQLDHSQDDAENDHEIKMILSSQRLDWDMLSPMSLTPEKDYQDDEKTKKSEDVKEKIKDKQDGINSKPTSIRNLIQSLYISGDEDSEDEIDSENYDCNDSVIENPRLTVNNNTFDLLKNNNTVEKIQNDSIENENSNSLFEEVKSPNEISDKNTKQNKSYGTSTKYKKLTNLQKIYKANISKNKIKNQLPLGKKHITRPKPYSISPIKYSSATLNQNKESRKLTVPNGKSLLCKKQVVLAEPSKGTMKSTSGTFKKPQPLPESAHKRHAIKQSYSGCELDHKQTNQQSETGSKIPNSSDRPHNPAKILPEAVSKTMLTEAQTLVTNNTCYPHAQNILSETIPKTRVCMPPETPLNTQTNIILPEFGRRKTICMPTTTHSNRKQESNRLTECSPGLNNHLESIDECDLTHANSKLSSKRISRVKSFSTNPPVLPNNQTDVKNNNNGKRKRCTSDTENENNYENSESAPPKKIRVSNDLVPIETDRIDVETKSLPSISAQDVEKHAGKEIMDNSTIGVCDIAVEFDSKNENNSRNCQQSDTSLIAKVDTPRPGDSNMNSIPLTKSVSIDKSRHFTNYNDMSLFTNQNDCEPKEKLKEKTTEWGHNLLDRMIFKYGSTTKSMKRPKHDDVVAMKFETGIAKCVEKSSNQDEYMKTLEDIVSELKVQGRFRIINGFMKYLNDPARKAHFVPVNNSQQRQRFAITVTKYEMVLIDIIASLEKSGITLWELILDSCEYILFTLEKGATPVFDIVDSVAHLYVNICKYLGNVSRLWMFMLNAMYCLSFKAIPLIKHCLDVVPRVLPYPNTYKDPGYAPMIQCFVFLLHFYNCDDPFKRVQELRERLKRKYHYNLQDENETTILFLLKKSIINLTEKKLERDMLELTLLIVAKRRGTKWCHKNIVQKILLPMIKGEIEVSYRGKRFCLATIGHIMKPYKNEMTVHSEEVVNLLINMFEQSQPHEIKEDIIRGLINMNMKTISERINRCLMNWNPRYVSSEFEETLEDYIQSKHISQWQIVHKNHFREI